MKLILERMGYSIGDVNLDGKINMADVVDLVDFIIGGAPEGFDKLTADVNQDGFINVTDVVDLVDIILDSAN